MPVKRQNLASPRDDNSFKSNLAGTVVVAKPLARGRLGVRDVVATAEDTRVALRSKENNLSHKNGQNLATNQREDAS